jgi:nucleolar protein 12
MPRKQAFIAKKLHEGRDSLNAYIVFKDKESAANSIALNGTVFENRHIRVDHSEKKAQKQTDIKRCVFVGNLSFNISDETLWSFFQDCGDIDYVRVVRDHKSNVGKGFGYVQFKERSSVALALKCNGNDVDGRKLRVSKATESEVKKPLPQVLEGTRASRNGSKRFIKPTLAAKKDISKKSRFAKNGAKFADEAIKPKKVKDMIKKPRWRNREMLNKPSE